MKSFIPSLLASILLAGCCASEDDVRSAQPIGAPSDHQHEASTPAVEEGPVRIEVGPELLRYQGEDVTMAELDQRAAKLPTNASVRIIADRSTLHKRVIRIMDSFQKQGIQDVKLGTKASE